MAECRFSNPVKLYSSVLTTHCKLNSEVLKHLEICYKTFVNFQENILTQKGMTLFRAILFYQTKHVKYKYEMLNSFR